MSGLCLYTVCLNLIQIQDWVCFSHSVLEMYIFQNVVGHFTHQKKYKSQHTSMITDAMVGTECSFLGDDAVSLGL